MDAASFQLNPAVCDRARVARDPRFDGRFFIGVLTTGIYCRPICPAPSPKRSNIRYFPTAAAAAETGLRPCLRCRPEAAPGTPAWVGTSTTVRRGLRLINEGALDNGSVDELATRLGVGVRHLHRLFVQHVGASPIVVAQTRRLHFAKRLLDDTVLPMTSIALASGFGSLRRFNAAFQNTYGRAPRELRREHRHTTDSRGDGLNLRLAYRPPYDWKSLHAFLAVRALPGVERITAKTYARTIRINEAIGWLEIRQAGTADALELSVHGLDPPALFSVVSRVRQMFDLSADPVEVRAVLRGDALLTALLRARPGLRLPGAWDPFEIAVRAVLGQQISVAAARTFAARLVAKHGSPISATEGLTQLFPEPAQLATADLTAIGLTRSRAATIRALAKAVRDGNICFDAGYSADELRTKLLKIDGIGSWTAEYIAMRGLGDPDAFPAEDLILRRMAGNGKALMAGALRKRSEAWRPWRAYAVMHLWRAASKRRD
ncbi:MAG TPA: AlkA N-terminal domain-containing protein [Gammaproteobacteria bacterium]|nr:AlkA N-terminal domain-containing protein [Gammaproteobacteria bacterium]